MRWFSIDRARWGSSLLFRAPYSELLYVGKECTVRRFSGLNPDQNRHGRGSYFNGQERSIYIIGDLAAGIENDVQMSIQCASSSTQIGKEKTAYESDGWDGCDKCLKKTPSPPKI